ncbi:hypothetical protein [Paenibacillus alkaliterrae]|uniref:hypothetical protein n=1 Tax=Paenibacillus alkaliterrae TaxID=320909 RepID=UPI0038B39B3B
MWWVHDDVNGHKAYHEFRREGRQTHRRFLALISGPVFGQITALIDWVDYSGKLVNVKWEDGVPSKSMIDVGIAMFTHPDNERFATQWFVRDSGAFTSANFHFNGERL